MNKTEHDRGRREKAGVEMSHNGLGPSWKRAHRDWRVVAVIGLMLIAMAVYVFTEDLAWGPRGRDQPQQPILDAARN